MHHPFGLTPADFRPTIPTGQPAATHAPTTEVFDVDYNYHPNALPTKPVLFNTGDPPPQPAPYTALTPVYVGLYQINFFVTAVPAGTPPCVDLKGVVAANGVQSNLTVSFGGAFSFDGAGICVAPS